MDHLKLENQLCFPLYATSRLITRIYQPLLEKLDLTYPQFLVMLVLWEQKKMTVGQIGKKLYLNTNTTTPLINKLIDKKYILKNRSLEDERIVFISLTKAGIQLQENASDIPECVVNASGMSAEDIQTMKILMDKFLLNATNNYSLELQN
jgi:DNA-binding MarR family transcriptional regulator